MQASQKMLLRLIAEQLARIIELNEYIEAADKAFAQQENPAAKNHVKR